MEDTLIFFNQNKDAVYAIGIMCTFFVSIISLLVSIRNNKSVQYLNAITKSRIEWIQKLRIKVSEFIAHTNIYNNVYYKGDYIKTGLHLSECQRLCTEIKLLLNYCDKRDKEIAELVDIIIDNYSTYCDELHGCKEDKEGYFIESTTMEKAKKSVDANIKKLCDKVQIYLKAEWNRVKYESQGKVYEKATEEFDYIELERKYVEPDYKNNVWKRWCINTKAYILRRLDSPQFSLGIVIIAIIILLIMIIG